MPCPSTAELNKIQARERERALADLYKKLLSGDYKLIYKNGKLQVQGWVNKGGWRDACAVNKLMRERGPRMKRVLKENRVTEEEILVAHGH